MFLFKRKNYSIKMLGRAGLIYTEGDLVLKIDSEFLTGEEFDIVIYLSRIPKNDLSTKYLSDEDIKRVKANISKEMKGSNILWE